MSCSCCDDLYQLEFDLKSAKQELKSLRKKGPKKNTAALLEALKQHDVQDQTLLDIGGGIGALQADLIRSGVSSAVSAEYSQGYIDVAREHLGEERMEDKVSFAKGDFVENQDSIEQADIVTLDKSICCYEDYPALIKASAEKCRKLYGIVIPRDVWWVKAVHEVGLFFRRLMGIKFRSYIHPVERIEEIISQHGFTRDVLTFQREWMIAVYIREG